MNIDFTAIAPLLEQLAQKLGVAVDHLWGVLVRQAINDGIGKVIIATIFICLSIASIKGIKYCKTLLDDDDMDIIAVLGIVLAGTILLTSLIVTPIEFIDGIKHFVNPEYYAYMDIMGQVKQ